MDNKKLVLIISGVVFTLVFTTLIVILIKNNIKTNDNEEKIYTITLINDEEQNQIKGKKDEVIKLPSYTKKGFKFIGFVDSNDKTYNDEYTISGDETLTAKYEGLNNYIITFVPEENIDYPVLAVYYKEKLILPLPQKEGYIFSHWVDENNNIFDYTEYPYERDITLKAIWTKKEIKRYTIKFDTDGGTKIDNQIVNENDKITKPSNPKKEGYCFTGWKYNSSNYNFDKSVKKNMTLKATYNELFSLNKDIFNLINLKYKELSKKFGIKENTIKKQGIISTNKGKGYTTDGSILYKNGYYAYFNFFIFTNENYNTKLNNQKPVYIAFDTDILFSNFKHEYITEENLKCLGYTNIKYVKKENIYKFNYGKYIIELYNYNTDKEKAYVWNIN